MYRALLIARLQTGSVQSCLYCHCQIGVVVAEVMPSFKRANKTNGQERSYEPGTRKSPLRSNVDLARSCVVVDNKLLHKRVEQLGKKTVLPFRIKFKFKNTGLQICPVRR